MEQTDRKLLKRFLSQYYNAKQRKSTLENRERALRLELRPARETADLKAKFGQISSRIQRQKEVEAAAALEVMDMIDFLPEGSTERQILELRHIDCKSWTEIERTAHFSRASCFRYYNQALDQLLAFKKVRGMLQDFQARMERIEKGGW